MVSVWVRPGQSVGLGIAVRGQRSEIRCQMSGVRDQKSEGASYSLF
jgi:hypothetical protein